MEVDGVTIPKDTRIYPIYSSANRDERKWENPDVFNIQRDNVKHHLGFGYGRHICAGQHLSLLEIKCLLSAMLQQVNHIEASGAEFVVNNIARGLSKLDVTFS